MTSSFGEVGEMLSVAVNTYGIFVVPGSKHRDAKDTYLILWTLLLLATIVAVESRRVISWIMTCECWLHPHD